MDDDFNRKKESRILDGLHYYLCSRDYNLNFDEAIENINLNVEGDVENQNNDAANIVPEELDDNKQLISEVKAAADKMGFTNLATIPSSFNDAEDYIKTFEAHLFTEAKAQIQKAQVSESKPPDQMKIISSSVVKLQTDSELFFRKFVLEKTVASETRYATFDFLVMSFSDPTSGISGDHMLGVVDRSEGDTITIKVVFDENGTDERNKHLAKVFSSDDENVWRNWYVQKFCSIVTIQREYEALHNFNELKIKEYLLNPEKLVTTVTESFAIPEQLENRLKEIYNRSQIEAISATLKKQGVTLIQGPPGTGKTRTVVGTVSVLINSFNKEQAKLKGGKKETASQKTKIIEACGEFNLEKTMPWMIENYVDWRDSTFDHLKDDFSNFHKMKKYITAEQTDNIVPILRAQEEHAPPDKILICGPSNSAIDEIVRKLKKEGLLDKNGNVYNPSSIIVRIGENFDKELEDVSLEYLVKQKLGELNKRAEESGEVRRKILKDAKIICGTLSSTGSMLLASSNFVFDTVVVDEAAQSTEISTLIPLQYNCSRLILIGDHNQLPATIFSKKCEKFNYHQSLFERFEKCKVTVHMLDQQYRMNPLISKFISDTFYEGKISDAEKIMEFIGKPDLYQLRLFRPLVFLNVEGNEIFEGASYKNIDEAAAIVEIYNKLKTTFPNFDLNKLGIITAYSRQVKEIKRQIKLFDQTEKCAVEVHTVDGFQGREKDIIIFSTVRAGLQNGVKNPKKTIGFLNDRRRMNVSFSRARLAVIAVGDLKQLKYSKLWKGLSEYSIKNDSCFNMEKPFAKFVDDIELHFDKYKVFRASK